MKPLDGKTALEAKDRPRWWYVPVYSGFSALAFLSTLSDAEAASVKICESDRGPIRVFYFGNYHPEALDS